KYNHRRSLAPFLAERLSFLIQTHPLLVDAYDKGNLVVTRVPSHRRRTWWVKGYNQSELLARSLAKKLDIPCIQICKKNKYTTSQTKLSREERLTNLYDSFHYIGKNNTQLEDKTILIIDDITTTGA